MLVLLFVCLLAFCNCQGPGGCIKYVINFDSPIYAFGEDSEKYVDTSEVFVERYNESHGFMHGQMKFLQGLDINTILEIVVLKEGSGRFEVLFSHDICDLCKELGDESSDYRKHLKYFGLPSECPIEPGAYPINQMLLEFDDIELQSSHVGRYEAQLNILRKTGDNCQTDRESLCVLKMDVMVEEELC